MNADSNFDLVVPGLPDVPAFNGQHTNIEDWQGCIQTGFQAFQDHSGLFSADWGALQNDLMAAVVNRHGLVPSAVQPGTANNYLWLDSTWQNCLVSISACDLCGSQ